MVRAIVLPSSKEDWLLSWHPQIILGILDPSWLYKEKVTKHRQPHQPRRPRYTSMIAEIDARDDSEIDIVGNRLTGQRTEGMDNTKDDSSWLPAELPEKLRDLVLEFSDIFVERLPEDLDKISVLPQMEVKTKSDCTNFHNHWTMKIPLHYKGEAEKELDRLED